MTNTQLFLLIFLVILPILIILFLLITIPSATQRAEIKRQIAEEEDKLRQKLSSYPRGSLRDELDFINISNNIHSQAVAIVKARMKNKAVKKEAREKKLTSAEILPSSTTMRNKEVEKEACEKKPTRVEILPSSTTSSKTEKQPSQNQQIVKEIAEENKVEPTKVSEKSIEQQIKEEEDRLKQNFPYAMGWKDAIDIHNEAVAIVKARMKSKKI